MKKKASFQLAFFVRIHALRVLLLAAVNMPLNAPFQRFACHNQWLLPDSDEDI